MASHNDDSSAQEENPYLALREAKIKRNEARLLELGLLNKRHKKDERPPLTAAISSDALPRTQGPTERPSHGQPSSASSSLPLRRSKRLSDQPKEVNYKDISWGLVDDLRAKRPRVVTPTTRNIQEDETSNDNTQIIKSSETPRPPPAANSVRSVSLCTSRLVIGSDNAAPGLLGTPMQKPGKEFVIYKSFKNAASTEDQQRLEGARLSFNKYSGVQEWQDCVFLWVNLGAKGNTVVNDFLDDGERITWFGGSRMFDETPVVQKLIRWGREATDFSSRIILWCRKFEPERKAFGPYVCLGRLSYRSHEPGLQPLAFVWNLLDAHRLSSHADAQVRETFQNMLSAT